MNNSKDLPEKIYREYEPKIRQYVRSHVGNETDAEDVLANIFLKVCEKADSYDKEKSALSTWVYAITHNAVVDYYRRRRPTDEIPEEFVSGELSKLDEICREETLEELADALESLDERLRDIIVLRYYNGFPLKEVAAVMEMSYANVKILHKKALNQMRGRMADYV